MWIRRSPSSAPWMALPKLGRRAIKSDTEFIERSWKSQKLHSVALLKGAFSRLKQEIRKNNINKYCTPESEKHRGFWDWAWITPKNSSVSKEERADYFGAAGGAYCNEIRKKQNHLLYVYMTCMTSTTCILSYAFHTTYTAIITSQILQIPRFTFHSEKGTERRDLPRLVAQAESYPANSSDSCCMLLLGSYRDGEPFGV